MLTVAQRNEASIEQLQDLESEQELLNNSLLALTTHFAQVQFRLRQIIQSDDGDKENLLRELEDFAFQGCPNIHEDYSQMGESLCSDFERRLSQQKAKHEELIFQLKFQLQDLETYARETSMAKSDEQIARHRLVLENLRNYLNIDVDDLYLLPTEDLQMRVQGAIDKMLSPLRSKEQMLYQLSTQVQDLERFIEFLHGTGTTPNALAHDIRRCTCNCPLHGDIEHTALSNVKRTGKNFKSESINLLSKTLFMLQVIAISSLRVVGFGWLPSEKPPTYIAHLRQLEEAVDGVLRLYSCKEDCSEEILLTVVRKNICTPLKELFGHGLRASKKKNMLVSCTSKNRTFVKGMHPWQLFQDFYSLQQGHAFTQQPQFQLSQSFGLRIKRHTINTKQALLSSIHNVKDTHDPYRRSMDAKFRSLITCGINEGFLGQWCRYMAQCHTLNEMRYESWSFMTKQGFSEAIKVLERLSPLRFDLPTDVALRIFSVPDDTEHFSS